jgi:hypothetical protein
MDSRKWSFVVGFGALAALAGGVGAAMLVKNLWMERHDDDEPSRPNRRPGRVEEVNDTIVPLPFAEFQTLLASRGGSLHVAPVFEEALLAPVSESAPLDARLVMLPQFLKLHSLIQRVRGDRDGYFPRDEPPLSSITVDFGRAHYFLFGQSSHIAKQVHQFIYGNSGDATAEERLAFFRDLGLPNPETALKVCAEVSPRRNALVTRVKYEMLVRSLEKAKRATADTAEIALVALSFANQHVLRHIKQAALRVIHETTLGRVSVHFCFFRLNYELENRLPGQGLVMHVDFINYIPQEGQGTWQMQRAVSAEDPFRIRAEFTIDLEEVVRVDQLGSLRIYCDGVHPCFGERLSEEAQRKVWGLYDADAGSTLRFGDTSPTW